MNAPLAVPRKFSDPLRTATGQERAQVALGHLRTLWFNTGTLCNLACPNCYIESSPRNDRLVYLTAAEVERYLDEAAAMGLRSVGFTGGEPFLNPELGAMLAAVLGRDLDALVLTNAMTPLRHARGWLAELNGRHPGRLRLRVSLDHYAADLHDAERGVGAFARTVEGLVWLHGAGFAVDVAARSFCGRPEPAIRAGFAALFARHGLDVPAFDPARLVIFPEMTPDADVPEIGTACWSILGKDPADVMCASSRMVVRRKGAESACVVACTLLPYDPRFELGQTLAAAARPVPLSHPYCSSFCVLGGGSCKT